MSTTAVVQQNTSAVLPIKNEIINFAVVCKLDAEGKIIPKSVRHTSSVKDIENLKRADYGTKPDGTPNPDETETIAFEQAVISPRAGTVEGFETIVTDADERLNIINKGIGSKFNQKIKTVLTELDEAGNFVFQPVEPTFDATPLIQEPALRNNLTPMDRAIKQLAALPDEMRNAILAQFMAVAQGQNVAE